MNNQKEYLMRCDYENVEEDKKSELEHELMVYRKKAVFTDPLWPKMGHFESEFYTRLFESYRKAISVTTGLTEDEVFNALCCYNAKAEDSEETLLFRIKSALVKARRERCAR